MSTTSNSFHSKKLGVKDIYIDNYSEIYINFDVIWPLLNKNKNQR